MTRDGIQFAVEAFRDAGFKNSHISVVLPENMAVKEVAAPSRKHRPARDNVEVAASARTKKAETTSATAVLDEQEEALLSVGPVAQSPDCSPCEWAPEELEAALLMLGIPQYDTGEYADKVLRGGRALLSVHCENADRTAAARRLHGDLGGMDVFTSRQTEPMTGKLYRSMAVSSGR